MSSVCRYLLLVLVFSSTALAQNPKVYSPPEQRKGATQIRVDEKKGEVTFTFPDMAATTTNRGKTSTVVASQGVSIMLDGEVAKKWIALYRLQKQGKSQSMGGLLPMNLRIALKAEGDRLVESVHRFEKGCIFDGLQGTVAYDWKSVEAWEKKGGYAKLGLPTKDSYHP